MVKGCKKVCSESKVLKNRNDGCYLQLNYDLKKKEVFTNFHCSFGHNSYTRYKEENIIFISFIDNPISMKEIDDLVKRVYRECAKDMF